MATCNFAKRTKFFILDVFAVVPLLAAILVPSKTTFYIAVTITLVLWWLSRKGLDINMLERKVKKTITGKLKYIRPSWRKEL